MSIGESRVQAKTRTNRSHRLLVVSVATVVTMLAVIFVVQDLARQPILVTSLASSTFLLYYQPLNEINRFKPLVFGHLLSAVVGFAAALWLPIPYVSSAMSITVSVALMSLLGIVYPPAVSTSLVFSYRPHDASAVATFMLTLVVVIVPAAIYILLHRGIKPSRWGQAFGLTDEEA